MANLAKSINSELKTLSENWENPVGNVMFHGIRTHDQTGGMVDTASIKIQAISDFDIYVRAELGVRNGHPDTARCGFQLRFTDVTPPHGGAEQVVATGNSGRGFYDWNCPLSGQRSPKAGGHYRITATAVDRDNCSSFAINIFLNSRRMAFDHHGNLIQC